MPDGLNSLAKDGVLRVAINTGNRALVQRDGEQLTGVSPALAKRLAEEIGAKMAPVIYEGAGNVFADAGNNLWDVGFLAIDATRAEKIAFTQPYIVIEATYAVRRDAPFQRVEEIDREGVQVLTATGSAYDMYLTETLRHASLERSGTPPESFAAFKDGRCDAVVGVRASLDGVFGDDPTMRVLSGALTTVRQAMVLPDHDDPRIEALDDFVARAMADGFVAANS